MEIQTPCTDLPCPSATDDALRQTGVPAAETRHRDADIDRAATFVLDDCLFALGQSIGTRSTLEYEALVWIRQHFHAKFARAIATFGNRWQQDRENVTGAAFMLGERAVRYAADRPSIGVDAIRRAAADVERMCTLHSRRAARTRGLDTSSSDMPLIAGYWCIPVAPVPTPGKPGGKANA